MNDYELKLDAKFWSKWNGNHQYLCIEDNLIHQKVNGVVHAYHLRIEKEIIERLSTNQLKTLIKTAEKELKRRR